MSVLSVNVGSSSIKFSLYAIGQQGLGLQLANGEISGLQPGGTPFWRWQSGEESAAAAMPAGEMADPHEAALHTLQRFLRERFAGETLSVIAHRVVHGGSRFHHSVRVDAEVMQQLSELIPLVPLHQPHNLAGIRLFQAAYPDVPQVACFDTAFHAGLSPLETTFAIPAAETERGIRRYGFHGLSYQFVSQTMMQVSERAHGKMLMLHLGSGSSLCATVNGQSHAMSMGFTAVDGMMMGSRCGYLDAGVVLHWLRSGKSIDEVDKLINKQSGLLGVSGISADMRTLRQSGEAQAQFACDLYAYKAVREAGALIACMGGLDVLVFTAGIGEHDAQLREQVCAGLAYMGVAINPTANQQSNNANARAIHAPSSRAEVWVCPTDEGRNAAEQALTLLD